MATKVHPAASSGDVRATLEALRDRLAEEIDETVSARDVATLSRQLAEVIKQLADLPVPEKRSVRDDIAARRSRRLAAPAAGSGS